MYIYCTDRSLLFGIEIQAVLHSRSLFSRPFVLAERSLTEQISPNRRDQIFPCSFLTIV